MPLPDLITTNIADKLGRHAGTLPGHLLVHRQVFKVSALAAAGAEAELRA